MHLHFFKYLVILFLFTACNALQNSTASKEKTKLAPKGFFSKETDSILLFEPILLFEDPVGIPSHEKISNKRTFTKKFHNAIDAYFTEKEIQHQFIVGDFMDDDKLNHLIKSINLSFDMNNLRDSLPIQKGFNLPPNKNALLIVHQIQFSSDFYFYDISTLPMNALNQQTPILEKVVDIKSYAFLFKNNTLEYFNSNSKSFNEHKMRKNARRAIRVYHSILKKLLFR